MGISLTTTQTTIPGNPSQQGKHIHNTSTTGHQATVALIDLHSRGGQSQRERSVEESYYYRYSTIYIHSIDIYAPRQRHGKPLWDCHR